MSSTSDDFQRVVEVYIAGIETTIVNSRELSILSNKYADVLTVSPTSGPKLIEQLICIIRLITVHDIHLRPKTLDSAFIADLYSITAKANTLHACISDCYQRNKKT